MTFRFIPKLLFLAFLLLLPGLTTASSLNIEVSNIEIDKIAVIDNQATLLFSCSVMNMSRKSGTITITFQGVDSKGHGVKNIRISDFVKAGKQKKLEDRAEIRESQYIRIQRWKLADVKLR